MNSNFKKEFKNLKPNEIKYIVNRCAGYDILEYDVTKDLDHPYSNKYFIKYMEDDKYGYWIIEYGWKKVETPSMSIGSGFFEYQIKITPFRVYFENATNKTFNPYSKQGNRKHLEEYLFVHINQKCPSYIDAIKEETENFIKFLNVDKNVSIQR